ncbi:MAG: 4-hydroxybenzoate octaprenyltransferase [Nitrospirales bacterium]|nr:MAG: 4-hydroxybenzoate octaprenyltransferase [Nitrospirales bacterium]
MLNAFPTPSAHTPSKIPAHKPSTFSAYARLIRLRNQSGTLLLVLPSLWALILASEGSPDLILIAIFILGAFFMRSAGVIFNDLADRSIDQKVERTKHRPLASGALTLVQAKGLASLIILLACVLVWHLNLLTIALSPIALLLAAIYPYAKRFIHIPQFILGVAFGWGSVMAWAAVRNNLDVTAWLLFASTICWAIAYDTIYALQDKEDDLKIGVKSSAILFGSYVWAGVGTFSALTIVFLGMAGWTMALGQAFYAGLAGISVFLSYQSFMLTQKHPTHVYFSMFKQHVWVGTAILIVFWIGFA